MEIDIEKMSAEMLAEPIEPTFADDIGGEYARSKELPKKPVELTERAKEIRAVLSAKIIADETKCELKSIDNFPVYRPEEENPDILIKGRWLERGGSAWWISTAGTGKSIVSVQMAFCMSAGLPFAGLRPNLAGGRKGLKFWIIQSEDSPSRITIDREDITAELSEQYPDVDWKEVRKAVKFLIVGGKVGAAFLKQLSAVLEIARSRDCLPDVIILNPFLAYVGGPITDGTYVTPFLRGGEINRIYTHGLQHLLEFYNIGAIIFHHTPKPPSDKELDGWMKSAFPEYQGAGSSDITNWGRSFVTMMKVKNDPKKVMLTAGKNGGEIGWATISGATRHFLAYSDGRGITGGHRHAWRELSAEEIAAVTGELPTTEKQEIDIRGGVFWLLSNINSFINLTVVEIGKCYRKEIDRMGGIKKYVNVTETIKEVVNTFINELPNGYEIDERKHGSKVLIFNPQKVD